MVSAEIPNHKLVDTALGKSAADMVISDGILMDVYTGRLLPHRSVAISDKWIAYVGPDARHTIGKNTRVIEAGGRVICPGYIESHTHLAGYWDISEFLAYAMPGGTTTFITEADSYEFALGSEGIRAFLDQLDGRPVKFYGLISPMVTFSPAAKNLCIRPDEAREFLKDPRIIGLGESYWQGVLIAPDNRVLELMQETLRAGKSVQGHAAGAYDKKLAAYAAAGAMSCHEAISTEDILARLELGYYAMIREGHVRRDLDIILPLKDQIDLRRVILVTDGTDPDLLIRQGYLVDVVQKAVDLGLEPIEAVRMVTLNPAEHFGLDHLVGGIAPGRFADILLLPEPETMRPDLVISNGRIVAENGKVTVPIQKVPYPNSIFKTVKIDPISISDLSVTAAGLGRTHFIRTIDIQRGGLITQEGKAKVGEVNGQYPADRENDLLKIVFIEKVSGRGEKFIGFIRGWGQKDGAVATTLCWDTMGVLAIGVNDNDLATAINRVIKTQGGTALSVQGRLLVDIPLTVGGFVSEMKIEDLAVKLEDFRKTVNVLGVSLEFPDLTLSTLTTPAIPFICMTEKGYFRFRENDIVGL